jgi:hypothetical protein
MGLSSPGIVPCCAFLTWSDQIRCAAAAVCEHSTRFDCVHTILDRMMDAAASLMRAGARIPGVIHAPPLSPSPQENPTRRSHALDRDVARAPMGMGPSRRGDRVRHIWAAGVDGFFWKGFAGKTEASLHVSTCFANEVAVVGGGNV